VTETDGRRRSLLGLAAMAPLLGASAGPQQPAPAAQGGVAADRILVTDYGAKGDGTTDDLPAIQRAIAAAHGRGGGTVILPHPGPWLVSGSIAMEDDVILSGTSQGTVVTRRGGSASDDAAIRATGKMRFRIQNLTISGTRRAGRSGDAEQGCDGISLSGCGYFDIDAVRADYCRTGFRLRGCYTFGIAQATALRCGSYGYHLSDSCTSFVLRNTTSWGCGGGWQVVGSVYGSLLGCACDHSDSGRRPDDPFGDSGGDYRRPGYVFDLSGSKGITIVAPGCEQSYSPWLYCEGTQATILNPYIYGMQAHTPDWRLIQLRGTGYSNVTIVNPFGFDSVTNHGGAPVAILIEDPARQRLHLSGRWRVNGFDGARAYPARGLVVDDLQTLLGYNGGTMVAGGTRLVSPHAKDESTVVVEGGRRRLRLVHGGRGVFSVPVPGEGLFQVKVKGTCSAPGGAALSIAHGGARGPARSWRGAGTTIDVDEWFYLPPPAERSAEASFAVTVPAGAAAEFETVHLSVVTGQI